ncbi:MAG: DUF1080 domain-containing protein [Verrucomicrobiaceae bacterium]|nr:MAG: DUF1080 domain-containing protein [Verrucomicrobiaceae bacterium]
MALGAFAQSQDTSEIINEPTESEVINEPTDTSDPKPLNTDGVRQLFNGKNLDGWNGLPSFWSVKDGAITGQTTAENPTKGNTFLVWQGGQPGDFELHFKYKLDGGNSGVQYRSKVLDRPKFIVGGYQADFEAGKTYSGILYEEQGRGILAQRGQKVVVKDSEDPKKPKIEIAGQLAASEELQSVIKQNDWNEYVIIAKGNHLQHFINGKQFVDVVDETGVGAKKGVIALQVHAGPPMKVQFKDMTLKELK